MNGYVEISHLLHIFRKRYSPCRLFLTWLNVKYAKDFPQVFNGEEIPPKPPFAQWGFGHMTGQF
jgi:hypothetical protein